MDNQFSLQQNFDEIDAIIKNLEDQKVPFEEMIALYEKGMKLVNESEAYLKSMNEKIKKIADADQETEVDF